MPLEQNPGDATRNLLFPYLDVISRMFLAAWKESVVNSTLRPATIPCSFALKTKKVLHGGPYCLIFRSHHPTSPACQISRLRRRFKFDFSLWFSMTSIVLPWFFYSSDAICCSCLRQRIAMVYLN